MWKIEKKFMEFSLCFTIWSYYQPTDTVTAKTELTEILFQQKNLERMIFLLV